MLFRNENFSCLSWIFMVKEMFNLDTWYPYTGICKTPVSPIIVHW